MKKYFILFKLLLVFFIINPVNAEFNIKAKTAILQDYLSGKILYEKEPDMSIYPASMTKIMTTIVAFDLIKRGDIKLNEKFLISENAWRLSQSGYSSMFIMVGDNVSVENLLRGIIVASGNDACVALSEGIAGTESEFAIMMTEKAQEIGMTNTNFSNSSGLSDPDNYSTVKDILIMSNYLIKNYPDFYEYFKEKEFTWNRTGGDPITQGNRNPLLYKNIGADGIKTGFLTVEKYSLAASLIRNERRLVAVGSGFETRNSRSRETAKLLTWGLTNFDTIEIAKKDSTVIELNVWQGKKNKINAYVKNDIYKTFQKTRKKYLKVEAVYNGPIQAPINKNDVLGKLKVYYKDDLFGEYNLIASESIKKINIFSRLIDTFNYLIWGDV